MSGDSDYWYNVYVLDDQPFSLKCKNCHGIVGERTGYLDHYTLISYHEYTVKPFLYKELCCYGGYRHKHNHKFEYVTKFCEPEERETFSFVREQYGRRGNLLEYGCSLGACSNPFFHDICTNVNRFADIHFNF